jgi:hypothetical protein
MLIQKSFGGQLPSSRTQGVGVMARITSFIEPDQRYRSLRIISALFSLIGIVLMVSGTLLLVFGLYTLLTRMAGTPPLVADPFTARQSTNIQPFLGLGATFSLIWSLGLLLSGLQFLAIGVLVKLAIHLEENTRISAQAMDKIRSRLEPRENVIEQFFRT